MYGWLIVDAPYNLYYKLLPLQVVDSNQPPIILHTHTHTYTMGYTLIIDNYDSFTWNVYADIAVLGGDPLVKRNDKITINEIQVRAIIPLPPSGGSCLFPS